MREFLHRRCKDIQPFYAMDFDDDSDDHSHSKKKRGLASSSSTSKEKTRKAKEQGQTSNSTKRAPTSIIEDQDNKEEMTKFTILSWLLEMKVVKEQEILFCTNRTHDMMIGQGIITKEGILCCCCKKMFSLSSFSLHSGDPSSADRPYDTIFMWGSMVSLLNCQIEAWNRHSVPARDGYHHTVRRPRVQDDHDDSCVICSDGGNLMCCEKCPSTYHPKCMGFEGVPQDEWHCPYCQCKYCDDAMSPTLRLTCFQCMKKYHWRCSQENDMIPQYLQPLKIPFCGMSCLQLHEKLEDMVGKRMRIESGLSWTLVHRMDIAVPGQNSQDLHRRANCNSMVALASKLMEDSFKLIVDRQTRTNMIQNTVYSCGSNFTRTNFTRFYTAVLEFRGQIVTAASLRTPSTELAEIPFIATAESWRNKGMCRILLFCIESTLASFGVERIVIPSSEDMVRNWQEKFGFRSLNASVEREIMTLNTLMFPRTTRLQKTLRAPKRREMLSDLNDLPPAEED